MRVGNYASGSARMHEAVRSLELAWSTAKEHWNDETSRSVEETHLTPICEQVKATIEATARLTEIVGKAVHECEPREEAI